MRPLSGDAFSVELTQSATGDLRDIYGYIRLHLMEPGTAARQRDRLKKAILGLSALPHRHALIADGHLREQGIRFFPVDNYLVFYIADDARRTVTVLRVLYARRDWQVVLADKAD